jgi:hypothetical protein
MWEHQLLPLFGKRPIPPSEAEREAAAVDLDRIKRGGIPLGAEQRLKTVAATRSPVFSSDLSAKEYAIAEASGLSAIAQIMGARRTDVMGPFTDDFRSSCGHTGRTCRKPSITAASMRVLAANRASPTVCLPGITRLADGFAHSRSRS